MSYRNPQIITPPNYGEIFARNMQYGAALVKQVMDPLLAKIKQQKESIQAGKNYLFDVEGKIDTIVDTGDIQFDNVIENYFINDASVLATMYADAARGRNFTELDVKKSERERLKKVNRVSNILTTVAEEAQNMTPEKRRLISLSQDENQLAYLGLIDSIQEINESGFSMVDDPETGQLKISYIKAFDRLKEGEKGEYAGYTVEEIEGLIAAGYNLREDLRTPAAKGEGPTIFNVLTNANKIIVGDADDLNARRRYGTFSNKGITPLSDQDVIYGSERDAEGKLIDNGLRDANGVGYGPNKQIKTVLAIRNFDQYQKDYRKVLNIDLNDVKLDKIFDDEMAGRVNPEIDPEITARDGSKVNVSAAAIKIAKQLAAQYGLANTQKDIEQLALDITSGRNRKNENGEYITTVTAVRDSQINNSIRLQDIEEGQVFNLAEIVHEYTLDELTHMGTTSAIYNQDVKGYTFTKGTGIKEQLSSISQGKKPPTVKGESGPTRTELQFAAARNRRLTGMRGAIDSFDKISYNSENAYDSGRMLLDLSETGFPQTESWLSENLGLKMSLATQKDADGNYPRRDYKRDENGELFGIFKFDSNAIAKDSKGVSLEMTLTNGKTSLFDIYEKVFELENITEPDGTSITAQELENTYARGGEDFETFIENLSKKYNLAQILGLDN